MSSQSLVTLAREFWADERAFLSHNDHPWFVWSLGKPSDAPIVAPTLSLGGEREVPREGEPLAIAVLKGTANVFPMGITVGRTENNDVVLRHEQVSRFHAYLQATPDGLALVDASSKNGTWVAGVKLVPTQSRVLGERVEVRFGQLKLRYYSSAAFVEFLRNP